jgi:tetratricopeptide (TPR) repeat protein
VFIRRDCVDFGEPLDPALAYSSKVKQPTHCSMSEAKQDRPKRVFISATTHDLKSYRELVTNWAKSKGYIPIVQEDFPAYPHDYSVKDVLRENLSSCDAVIHLAGLYYGAEPTGYVSPESRHSYTQLEYDLAKILRRQLFVLIASEGYKADNSFTDQSPDLSQLQRGHRQRIRDSGGMRYPFLNHEELSQQLQKIEVTGVADRPNNLPVVGSLFKGRDDFLLNLRSKVEGKVGSALVISTKHTIHGLGGIGKTRLAIEYANRYSEHYTALLFVVADSPESLRANIANLCGALRIDEPEPAKQYDAAIKWLQKNPGWFLIVDNVDTKEAASAVEESILGMLKEGHILVTSRLSTWRNRHLDPLELDVISEDASVELLLEGTDGQRKPTQSDNQRALELAKRLGYLPLALQQAVGFISTRHCSFEEYLNRWDSAEKKVVEWHDEPELKYPRSIATTWELSFDEMKPEGKQALRLICWLAPDPIPKALLYKVSQVPNSFDMEEGIAELEKYSFLRWVDNEKELVQVHALVSEIARYRMSEEECHNALEKTLSATNSFIEPYDPDDEKNWPSIFHPCSPHIKSLTDHARDMDFQVPTFQLMNILGIYLQRVEVSDRAVNILESALAIGKACYGDDHPSIASAMNNLGQALQIVGRYREAELLFQNAILSLEKGDGRNDDVLAILYNNLGMLFLTTDRKIEAESFSRKAYQIFEMNSNPGNQMNATVLNNLAGSLSETGCFIEAESIFRKALKAQESLYGPNHPKVALIKSNLAVVLSEVNRCDEAESLIRSALEIDEVFYGKTHSIVAQGLNSLAILLFKQNRYNEADELFARSCKIVDLPCNRVNPITAQVFFNYARFLEVLKRFGEAEQLFRRALECQIEKYGSKDPILIETLKRLASLLKNKNQNSGAATMLGSLIEVYKEIYGENHSIVAEQQIEQAKILLKIEDYEGAQKLLACAVPVLDDEYGPGDLRVLAGKTFLAQVLQKQNRLREAEGLLKGVVAQSEQSFGIKHSDVARRLNNLAFFYQQSDRHSDAESILRRVIAQHAETSGVADSILAVVLTNLSISLRSLNRQDEALESLREALRISEKIHGSDDPATAERLHNLAIVLESTNRFSEAESVYSRAFKILLHFGLKAQHEPEGFRALNSDYCGFLAKRGLPDIEIRSKIQAFFDDAKLAIQINRKPNP